MKVNALYWILGIVAVLYVMSKSAPQTGQEGNTTTSSPSVGSNPFWTVGSGFYSQHFPSGAQ